MWHGASRDGLLGGWEIGSLKSKDRHGLFFFKRQFLVDSVFFLDYHLERAQKRKRTKRSRILSLWRVKVSTRQSHKGKLTDTCVKEDHN